MFSGGIKWNIDPKWVNPVFLILLNLFHDNGFFLHPPQPAFTCSKLTIETLEQDVKYVPS